MNKTIKTVLGGVLFVIIVIGLWNLFDFIWKTWISRNSKALTQIITWR